MTTQEATATKKPIAPTLQQMKIGQTEKFAHRQYDGVHQGVGRLHRKFRGTGLRFQTRTTDEGIEVTRVA